MFIRHALAALPKEEEMPITPTMDDEGCDDHDEEELLHGSI
jgi:hypothetical protein